MANFSENTSDSEDEEVQVEIKPDAQSLSQQSTGDSTFERRQGDRVPLVKKSRGRAWKDDDMRSSAAELELTAQQVLLISFSLSLLCIYSRNTVI